MSPKIFIETNRLHLRQWQVSDEEIYINMNLDKEVMEFFPSIIDSKESLLPIKKMAEKIDHDGYGLFAVERKDTLAFIGYTGFAYPKFTSFFTPVLKLAGELPKNIGTGVMQLKQAKRTYYLASRNFHLKGFIPIPQSKIKNLKKE